MSPGPVPHGKFDWPPAWYWLIPLSLAALKLLPVLYSYWLSPPPGFSYLHVGYIPKDFFQYAAFIRQVADSGSWLWYNPFSTLPHEPRFFLFFFWLLGWVCAAFDADPLLVLELSRWPALGALFAVLWWFLHPVFPDREQRLVAVVLVGFAGGVDGVLRPLLGLMSGLVSAEIEVVASQQLWHLVGWSTFAWLHNSLWVIAVTVMLLALRPALQPGGPRTLGECALVGGGLLVTWLSHPYTGLVAFGILVGFGLAAVLLRVALAAQSSAPPPPAAGGLGHPWRLWLTVGLVALALGGWTAWQRSDEMFRGVSNLLFGTQNISVFWYPVTFGALGLAAASSVTDWRDRAPHWGGCFAVWIVVIALFHSCPFLNGYHYVMYLHLPIAILAAPAATRVLRRLRAASGGLGRGVPKGAVVMAGLAFVSVPMVTAESLLDVRRNHLVPATWPAIVSELESRAAGWVLGPPELGNMVPAFAPHRVWVGHWALTPQYELRAKHYARLTREPLPSAELARVLIEESINYAVLPGGYGAGLAALEPRLVLESIAFGDYELVVLGRPGGARKGTELMSPTAVGGDRN